jgi:glycosyltransferase involved in cell wall biosynthesis
MKAVVVIPCFNETHRLDVRALDALRDAGVGVLCVDDGSSDGTAAHIEAAGHRVLRRHHRGKGEAVRAGLLAAADDGAEYAGWLDADFATPASEWLRLLDVLRSEPSLRVVLGSRVAHLGATIERRAVRHYLGRVFATAASLTLGLPVYDTQCGAKVLRLDDTVRACLAAPLTTTWAFDVELLQRLLRAGVPPAALREVPLSFWRDVGGGRLGPLGMVRGAWELARLARRRSRTGR